MAGLPQTAELRLSRAAPGGRLLSAAFARRLALLLLLLLLALPLTLTDLPPLLDYPNHLARMYVLLTHTTHPAIAAMYDVHWRLIPNIGMDLVVPLLARVMPLELAGRLYAAAALLLPVLGTVLLHRAAFGGRSLWPLVVGSVAYHGIFLAGFLNYLVGAGLALIGAALWLRLRAPLPRIGVAVLLSPVIFVCHLFAWAFYALLIGSIELAACRGRPPRAIFARLAGAALPFLAPAACVLADAAATPAPRNAFGSTFVHMIWWKIVGVLSPTAGYVNLLDTAALALLLALMLLPLLRRRLDVAWSLVPACAALAIAFVVLPFHSHNTGFVDTRMPILAVFVLIAMTRPRAIPKPLLAAFAAVSVARYGLICVAFAAHNADIAAFRATIAEVPPGARVAVVSAFYDPQRGPEPIGRRILLAQDALMHMPGLLVIDREAFWPLLFSARGKQPIEVRPPYDRIAMAEGWLPSWRELAAPTEAGRHVAPYLADWREDFDYLICLYAGRLADPAALDPGGLRLVHFTPVAALYQVVRP